MILAGPPCQGHSSLNNHTRHQDPKNFLYLTVPAVAVALGARHIVIENVPNVVADKYGVVQTTMALLRANGYHLTSVCNCRKPARVAADPPTVLPRCITRHDAARHQGPGADADTGRASGHLGASRPSRTRRLMTRMPCPPFRN